MVCQKTRGVSMTWKIGFSAGAHLKIYTWPRAKKANYVVEWCNAVNLRELCISWCTLAFVYCIRSQGAHLLCAWSFTMHVRPPQLLLCADDCTTDHSSLCSSGAFSSCDSTETWPWPCWADGEWLKPAYVALAIKWWFHGDCLFWQIL